MPSIVDFLNARLDEDEATARAAADEKRADWRVEDEAHWESDVDEWHEWPGWIVGVNPNHGPNETVIDRDPDHDGRAARHIARHDPARVLREVKAKRVILAAHPDDEGQCERCLDSDGISHDEDDQTYAYAEMYPCPTVKALAAVYAGHPDYDHSWG